MAVTPICPRCRGSIVAHSPNVKWRLTYGTARKAMSAKPATTVPAHFRYGPEWEVLDIDCRKCQYCMPYRVFKQRWVAAGKPLRKVKA